MNNNENTLQISALQAHKSSKKSHAPHAVHTEHPHYDLFLKTPVAHVDKEKIMPFSVKNDFTKFSHNSWGNHFF